MASKKPQSNENPYGKAAANRKAEQAAIEQAIKTGEKAKSPGRPVKGDEKAITVTVRMTESRRRKLKAYAATRGMSVSEILSDFVDGLEEK